MSRSRVAIVIVLIISLVAAGFTRSLAWHLRGSSYTAAAKASGGTSLSSMNSFALALLLGGLRGPLVMLLWTSSESQKTDKNLEDFDTKVEWIRLLQPEFDTVHIFQIWNKAYNISVQMASLANKYATILDALEYAHNVDKQRPDNINILHAIGGIYFDKLGGSAEKKYYRERVRTETLPHSSRQKLARGDPGWRPLEHEPLLDNKGMILPQFLKPTHSRPPEVPQGQVYNSGAELQFLEPYQPFPYGISTLALGYNYFKRAQVLQDPPYNQRHAQLSDMVIDSRPALALRDWSQEEREIGRRVELTAYGKVIPEEPLDMELPTADIPVAPPPDPSVLQKAIYCYERSVRLGQDALKEYARHLKNYSTNFTTYQQHMDHLKAMGFLAQADADYLKATTASGDEKKQLMQSSADHYIEAMRQAQLIVLKYYVDDEMARQLYPNGADKQTIEKQPPELYTPTLARVLQAVQRVQFDSFAEDRGEYMRYLQRCALRLKQLQPYVVLPGQSATRATASKPAGSAAQSTTTALPAASAPAR